MPFKVDGEARFPFTNTPGQVPQPPDNGELKVQQADGLLATRRADGGVRLTDLRPMVEQLASGPLADKLLEKATLADITDALAELAVSDIPALNAALASKATAADIAAAVGMLTAGAPDGANTFAEVAARNAAAESALAALSTIVNGKVSTAGLPALLDTLLGAARVTPSGATVSLPLASALTLDSRFFGAVPDGQLVLKAGSTTVYEAIGTDNTDAFRLQSIWCRNNNVKMRIYPGLYRCVRGVEVFGVDVEAEGAFILRPNIKAEELNDPGGNWVFRDAEAPEKIELAETAAWGGWFNGSRRITGLTTRKGQYVYVESADYKPTPTSASTTLLISERKPDSGPTADPIVYGEGARVTDEIGTLAHTLYSARVDNKAWTSVNAYAKRVGRATTVSGLVFIVYNAGGVGTGYSTINVQRPNTKFVRCGLINRSGLPLRSGFNVDSACDIEFEKCFIEALGIDAPGYGFNSGLSAGITYRDCWEEGCRRGFDATRSKHIRIDNCVLPDGWGAHYAWWMGSEGGIIGGHLAGNPQCVMIAGGNFYCRNAEMSVHGAANTVCRYRGDVWAAAGSFELSSCRIDIVAKTALPPADNNPQTLMENKGPNGGFDYGIRVEMPSKVTIRDNEITLRGPRTLLMLVNWCINYGKVAIPGTDSVQYRSQLPFGTYTDSRWTIEGNKFNFPDGGFKQTSAAGETPITYGPDFDNTDIVEGASRLQIFYNKPETAEGPGVVAQIADLPSLLFQAHSTQRTDENNVAVANNRLARISARIERVVGDVRVFWSSGSYRRIFVDCDGTLTAGVLSPAATRPRFPDEFVSTGLSLEYPVDSPEGQAPKRAVFRIPPSTTFILDGATVAQLNARTGYPPGSKMRVTDRQQREVTFDGTIWRFADNQPMS
ncbi:MAG: hypothetical protein WAP03_19330 [Methylorubrum rhodinum]|uniref:hypothetical protein n=1 Tax=Methylorubrum rhodinum TaxID=29428 RepID=UPI003BB1FD8C